MLRPTTHFSFLEFEVGICTAWKSLLQECLQILPFKFVAGDSLLGEVPLGWWRGRDASYPLLHKACDSICMLWHDAKAASNFNQLSIVGGGKKKNKECVRFEICLGICLVLLELCE